jgi:hypothetical protein
MTIEIVDLPISMVSFPSVFWDPSEPSEQPFHNTDPGYDKHRIAHNLPMCKPEFRYPGDSDMSG